MKHSEETKYKISETLKRKKFMPPYWLSPCYKKGWSRIEIFGKEKSEKITQKILKYNFGKKRSEETKLKMRLAKIGKKRPSHSIQTKEKIRNSNLGKRRNLETKKRISLSHGGTGIPYENNQYNENFNEKLRNKIRKRDNYLCQGENCSMTQEEHFIVYGRDLEVHHIDYNKLNCEEHNLITLCKQCHIRTNYNRDYWKEYYGGILNGKRVERFF
jgi:hypothetical protein